MTVPMLEEVLRGLRLPQKVLPPKYFYDERGSVLFEEITDLPEYYLTRTESRLLERLAPGWMERIAPRSLVELGAGSARKTRILLDSMQAAGPGSLYVPLDVSADFLRDAAERLREEYPELTVEPEVADMTRPLELSVRPPSPTVFALLGSTLGNFEATAATRLLGRVRAAMGGEDVFLLGVDLRPSPEKPVARLEAAYDDAQGVTAEFNLNVLRVLNRELGADFDLDAFEHRAFYDGTEDRIEMHLVSTGAQTVHFPGGVEIPFREGESVRTEISCKYDRPTVEGLLGAAGMVLQEWHRDREGLYALCLAGVD